MSVYGIPRFYLLQNLVLGIGYLTKLVANTNVKNYLAKNHTDIFSEFEALIKTNSVEIS